MNGRQWDEYETMFGGYEFFRLYRDGKLSKPDFVHHMHARHDEIVAMGVAEYNFNRLLRCVSGNREVDAMLEDFRRDGGLDTTDYGRDGFAEFSARVKPVYHNGSWITEILPEDELCMYALASLTNPKHMFIAGAYFGYWALWAMPAIQANGGMCVLSDVNPAVIEIARRNMDALGYGPNALCLAEDAEKLLLEGDGPIDLLALDANGSGDDPRPTHRGKRLYDPLLSAARHRLHEGSYIIVHNLERDSAEMQPFLSQIDSIATAKAELISYNGLGIYKV